MLVRLMRKWLAIALASLLAGCASNSDSGSQANDLNAVDLVDLPSLKYSGCSEHMAVVPVPAAIAAGNVPSGFEPVTFDPAGQLVQMLAISFSCELNGTDAREFMGAIAVTPPAQYVDEEAVAHAWMLGGWVTSDVALMAYDAWGVALMEKDDIVFSTDATPVARYGYAGAGNDDFSASLDTIVQGPAGTQAAGHARVFHPGGLTNQTAPKALLITWNESATMEGEAVVALAGGIPPSALPGIGVHNWGDDYWINIESIDLVAEA